MPAAFTCPGTNINRARLFACVNVYTRVCVCAHLGPFCEVMFTCLGEAGEAGSVRNRLGSMSPSCAGDSMPGSLYFAVLSRLPFHAGGSNKPRSSRACASWNARNVFRIRAESHAARETDKATSRIRVFPTAGDFFTRSYSTVRNGIGPCFTRVVREHDRERWRATVEAEQRFRGDWINRGRGDILEKLPS